MLDGRDGLEEVAPVARPVAGSRAPRDVDMHRGGTGRGRPACFEEPLPVAAFRAEDEVGRPLGAGVSEQVGEAGTFQNHARLAVLLELHDGHGVDEAAHQGLRFLDAPPAVRELAGTAIEHFLIARHVSPSQDRIPSRALKSTNYSHCTIISIPG